MKTTIDLPDELVRALKIQAVTQGRTLKEFVSELLRQGMGLGASPSPQTSVMIRIAKGGLPRIQCASDAPATRMSGEELLTLENQSQLEEDLQRAGLTP